MDKAMVASPTISATFPFVATRPSAATPVSTIAIDDAITLMPNEFWDCDSLYW